MTTYKTLDDALQNAPDVESLSLDCEELSGLPDQIEAFVNLKSLRLDDLHSSFEISPKITSLPIEKLDVSGQKDMSVPFPPVLFDTTVTDLEIRHFRVREVFPLKTQLTRFRLASYFIFDDMVPLFENLTALEYLEIWGYHAKNQAGNKKNLEFPASIANLKSLAELECVSAGMNALPDEIAELENLHIARFRNHDFTEFPLALTKTAIRDLEFSHMKQLDSIPDELQEMPSLRTLNLAGSWNGGDLPDSWSDKTYKPVPPVLGRLSKLESLSLKHCAVPSLDELTGLDSLKILHLDWPAFKDLSPLQNLENLEELYLEYAPVKDLTPLASLKKLRVLDLRNVKVKDLSPLAACENLESLNIESSRADENPAKALQPLLELPNLNEVKSRTLGDGGWEKLRNSEPIEADEVVKALSSDSLEEVVGAIRKIVLFSDDRSTDDMNALLDFFGLDEDLFEEPEPIEFEPLDQALARWGDEIPAIDLAGLARATFVSTYDGWNATVLALRLLVERGDVEAQKKFVEAWFRATQYYDGGHRMWEDTVHDQLIDDLWEGFHPEALAILLVGSPGDELDTYYGDGLANLFVPTLSGLKTFDQELIDRVREFAFRNIDDSYGTPPTETMEMLVSCIDGADPSIASALVSIVEEMKQAMEAGEDDESMAETVETDAPAAISELRAAAKVNIQEELQSAFNKAGVDPLLEKLELAKEHGTSEADRDVAAVFTNNKLIQCLQQQATDDAVRLIASFESYVAVVGMPGGQMRNELAGNTIVLVVYSGDPEVKRFFFDSLLPDHIAHTGLAYNLSCYWATEGDRDKMLAAINVAIELGKEKLKFMNDTDFKPYWQDADFLELVT